MGETYDEGELEDELAELEQEALDTKMLDSGNVPVSDQVHRLPAAVNPESEFLFFVFSTQFAANKKPQSNRRRRYNLPRWMTRKRSYESCRPRWPCDTARFDFA